ncbi:two-component regulator propeller domain-containing protein [uncultured Alistipes sp.]|uniref:hybrid sensor histidine kinase/response regulator transcription factor n=1 Tax=uncultured Alistipes sp. TaxID=538949 RepID=UPI0026255805|nr:two-component regulator propeller domain-containing protein [uncultured Alistipes sp.]
MKKAWIAILTALLSAGFVSPVAIGRGFSFLKHSVNDGLSQSTVTAIVQDRQGNIWLGTQDGLNRYDGYGFEVFHGDPGREGALGDSSITALLLGSDGRLWIGTSTGLSCYDFRERRFRNHTIRNVSRVTDILEVGPLLMLATDSGIHFFDPAHPETPGDNLLAGINVRTLCFGTGRGEILVGSSSGLYGYEAEQQRIHRILPEMSGCDVSAIVRATDGGYWISTHGNGLYRIDEALRQTARYTQSSAPGLASDYIRVLKCDQNRRLWVGTYNGLSILDEKSGAISRHIHTSDPSSISHDSVWSICIDNQQGVWLGTYYGGVNYYHPLADRFEVLKPQDPAANGPRPVYGTVSCIVADPREPVLWIGTNDDGIFRYDPATGHFTSYNDHNVTSTAPGGLSNNIKCILPDDRGGLYVGTHVGGLNYLDVATRRAENFPISNTSPINNGCYTLLDEGDGTLWVGTLSGLLSFDKRTRRFSRHAAAERAPRLASQHISTLFRDSKRRVWVGTDTGLYLCSEGCRDVRSLSDTKISEGGGFLDTPSVLCITEDSRGSVWIGTKQGLLRYDEEQSRFTAYTHRDGLPNDYVYGILEDDMHRLWLSTNNGLSCFDIREAAFRNYRRTEGIANNQFNIYAYCRDRSGTFYFGGLDGITSFRPFELRDNPYAPAPHITDLVVFNDQAGEREQVDQLREADGSLTEAALSARLNLVSIRFSAVNQLAGSRNRYRYTLEGFDDQWYETGNREVSYSNLAPGSYTFRVQAANNDGIWSDREATLLLRILPRWWQTAGARAGFFALLLGLIGVVVGFLTSRMRMQLELNMERKEKERIEELSQEKIRFYVNLSHELRTPLTLILSPLQEIEEHGATDKYVQTRLQYIHRSSTKLLHIVNQMLDYRKAELGMFKIQVAMQNVDEIAGGVFSLFSEIAQNRDMDYIFDSELKGEQLPVDRQFVEMMLTNLLTNAFKFTPSGGIIRLSLAHRDGRLTISVHDSGIGIASDLQKHIFERFYQIDESRMGTGIGLSIVRRLAELHHGDVSLRSEEGRFSEFTLSLPDSLECYTEEELQSDRKPQRSAVSEDLPGYLAEACTPDSEAALSEPQGPDGEERETILLVVDDPSIRNYMTLHFRGRYAVYAASDGQQALDLLKSIEPAVIIADRVLHGMDGLKLCQAVKQNIRTCHIPVILLASKDSMEDQITGIEAGADDYVAQPFSITLLQAKVNNLLKSRYRLRHHYSNSAEVDPDKITSNAIDGEFLKRAIRAVEENMDNENFSSNDFAQALCMSRSNLHLKITSITGESATKFIRKIRFNYACKLLLDRKYTIAEISSMVGFSSPSYFATSFKKHVGCLPTEYVRRRTEGTKESVKE